MSSRGMMVSDTDLPSKKNENWKTASMKSQNAINVRLKGLHTSWAKNPCAQAAGTKRNTQATDISLWNREAYRPALVRSRLLVNSNVLFARSEHMPMFF